MNKISNILTSMALIFVIHSTVENLGAQTFSSIDDTIVLETVKKKGFGLFPAGAGQISFKDTSEEYDYPVFFPANISEIKLGSRHIDIKPFQYANLQDSKSEYITTFLNEYYPSKIDTANLPSMKDNTISIMTGKLNGDEIFVIDENCNKDFRDDAVRLFREMDWTTSTKLIKCDYLIYDGNKIKLDSTWVNVGTIGGDKFLFFVSHHLTSHLTYESQKIEIGVIDGQSNFCFDEPILAVLSWDGEMKDSLLKSELLEKGEYLKLGIEYYRFDDIANDGRYIRLVREEDVSDKFGTQVGFIAPDFSCRTINADSIVLKDFEGKYLLLANITACWSPIMSYEYYKQMYQGYSSKIDILAIDNSPNVLRQNIEDLNLEGDFVIADTNMDIKEHYREDYCSRTCFLIDPSGRIVDKFEIGDWRTVLKNYFD